MANVVLLMSDEHNPFFSSPYGHPTIHTPNMQRLAERGGVFENAYCPSPLCMPSRSAFLAGRRVHDIQVYSNCNVALRTDFPSLGAALVAQGVHAAEVGKVHGYDKGANLGFSELHLAKDAAPPGDCNHARRPLKIRAGAAARGDGYGPAEEPFRRDPMRMDAALEWLRTRAREVAAPWVLWVNIDKPHFAHYVTQELWDSYPDGGDLPAHGRECESAQHPYAQDLRAHFETEQFTEAQVRGLRRGYLGCVTYVDRQLGRIADALREIGQLEETNLIYTTDHGEMLGKFGMWWKCSLYEDSVRVPLIAAGPDFSAGTRTRTPVDLHDLRAGVFRCVGAEQPAGWCGDALQDIPEADRERVVFSEYHGHGTRSGAYMIRQGDWKLIYCMEAPHQLFDVAEDPQELTNLYEREREEADKLEAELRSICSPEGEDERAHAFQARQFEILGAAGNK